MALLANPSPSPSTDSHHTSSPEPDRTEMDPPATLDASSAAQQLQQPSGTGTVDIDQPGPSTSNTPTRRASPTTDLTRSRSTGRGGCWTCRVRRKKCDEERVDDDSCKTCRRLGIHCLGWGARRPDWMRDKEKVAEYKASIKAQLTRAGLIRGQPRALYAPVVGGHTSAAGPSTSPAEHYATSALPGPSSLRGGRNEAFPGVYGFDGGARYGGQSQQQQPHASIMSALSGLGDPLGAGGSPALGLPSPFVMQGNPFDQLYGGDLASMSTTPTYGTPNPNAYLQAAPQQQQQQHTPEIPPSLSPSLRDSPFNEHPDPYITYYFENLRKLQFVLAGREHTNTLWLILQTDPQGPLSHAICALASLHSRRAAAAQAYDAAPAVGDGPERTLDRRFYNKANFLLMSTRASGRAFSENDAVAAVFLISYHSLVGGGTGWMPFAEVAYEWLAQTRIHQDQNPKLTLVNMTAPQKLAAKLTMWIDILSAVVFNRPPRFLPLIQQLFGATSGGGYWASANNEHLDIRMDKLTGCPDNAVLALAEIANLAAWKASEASKGTLSMRELVRRGEQIEQTMFSHPTRTYAESPTGEPTSMLPTGMPAAAVDMSPSLGGSGADELTKSTVAAVWQEAAVLYLNTVVNGAHPSIPEITKSTNTLIDHIHAIGPSHYDRAMVFPLVLTGCMAEDPLVRELVRQRLQWHHDDFYNGNMAQARTYVEYVSARRNAARNQRINAAVDWRDCMRERWSAIIMI